MFKVNNVFKKLENMLKDTARLLILSSYFTPSPSASIFDFEQVTAFAQKLFCSYRIISMLI